MVLKRFGLWLGAGLAALAMSGSASAETCGRDIPSLPGETLQNFAARVLGSAEDWRSLYFLNETRVPGPNAPLNGISLDVPCLDAGGGASVTSVEELETTPDEAELRFITGGNYAPFTDKDWPHQGLITQIVREAMASTTYQVSYSISWDDDWSVHLFPKLAGQEYDMGFPWYDPNCQVNPSSERCNFLFSDSLFEVRIVLYVKADSELRFDTDDDIHGMTLCRPRGYFTHDLDRPGRRWLSDGDIDLITPEKPDDCFQLLAEGRVDAVTVNEFVGKQTVFDRGEIGQVREIRRPVSIESFHMLIYKRRNRATTFMYRFNEGVRALRRSRRYNEIVGEHLDLFYDSVNWPDT